MSVTCPRIPILHLRTCNYEHEQHYSAVTLRPKLYFFLGVPCNIHHVENYLWR